MAANNVEEHSQTRESPPQNERDWQEVMPSNKVDFKEVYSQEDDPNFAMYVDEEIEASLSKSSSSAKKAHYKRTNPPTTPNEKEGHHRCHRWDLKCKERAKAY